MVQYLQVIYHAIMSVIRMQRGKVTKTGVREWVDLAHHKRSFTSLLCRLSYYGYQ